MRETPYSTIEKNFLKKALGEKKRLDGRHFDERRKLRINFGKEYGCCHVSLGDTRVLAQVTSEIQQPKSTRPNEGQIFINVEFSPMSAEHVEPGKPSEDCVIVNRVLEKCIRESKCVDLESLCIIADEKVWALRVDITILNMEGNIIECSSIAALAALAHYRRPDVTSTGERIIVHEYSDKEPIQTALHHYPICLTYAIFNKGNQIVADPSLIEEQTAEASLSVGMNAYRELCGIHLGGLALSDHTSVLKVVQKAGTAAADIVQFIKKTLAEDEEARSKNETVGLSVCIRAGRITTLCDQQMKVKINSQSIQDAAEKLVAQTRENKHTKWDEDGVQTESGPSKNKIVVNLGENSAEIQDASDQEMEGSSDDNEDSDVMEVEEKDKEDESEDDAPVVVEHPKKSPKLEKGKKQDKKAKSPKKTAPVPSGDGSDDELVVVQELTKEEKEKMKKVETLVLDDSDEEGTTTLTAGDMEKPSKNEIVTRRSKQQQKKKKNQNRKNGQKPGARQWYSQNAW